MTALAGGRLAVNDLEWPGRVGAAPAELADAGIPAGGLLTDDPLAALANAFFRKGHPLLLSDDAAAEFASAIARRVRMGTLAVDAAGTGYATFDAWAADSAEPVETVTADVEAAAAYARRLDLPLRAPDALHVAMAIRMTAWLATFDLQMAASARATGAAVAAA